jgi:hypothetical protein
LRLLSYHRAARRLHIGKDIPVNIDSGPSGKSLAGEYLDYAKSGGDNNVFTDSLIPDVTDVPLRLASSYLSYRHLQGLINI